MSKPNAIGIDLGTNYSRVAVVKDGQVHVIQNSHGNRRTPAWVAFGSKIIVGEDAEIQADQNTHNTLFGTKRLIGHKCSESCVESDIKHLPFKVISNEGGKPKVQVDVKSEAKNFTPEEITAMILIDLKHTAEAYLGSSVTHAVITVPACFTDSQLRSVKEAAALAGLNVLRLVAGSTVAALSENQREGERNVLMVDLGGGSLDVSLIKIYDSIYEVLAVAGNNHLGGEDFTTRMVEYFAAEFRTTHEQSLSEDQKALQILRFACEAAKISLSSSTQASIGIISLHDGIDFHSSITRVCLEDICVDLLQGILLPVEELLNGPGGLFWPQMSKSDVDDVVLLGGSSHIPKVQQLMAEYFAGKEVTMRLDEQDVVKGAALLAAIISGDRSECLQDVLLLDIVPISLGVQIGSGTMRRLITRNTTIPTNTSQKFTTCSDNQRRIIVKVYEGEHSTTDENTLLGIFELSCIQPAPRGVPIIEITFDIDAGHNLTVHAKEVSTGNESRLIWTNEGARLTREVIENMADDITAIEMFSLESDVSNTQHDAEMI